jgi:hypothetical protein
MKYICVFGSYALHAHPISNNMPSPLDGIEKYALVAVACVFMYKTMRIIFVTTNKETGKMKKYVFGGGKK